MPDTLSLRERKKQQTKQRIMDVALQLFQTQGYDATTMDAIAAAADMSRGTVFNHFPSKESLLGEIAVAELCELERRAAQSTLPRAADRLRLVLRTLLADTLPFRRVTQHVVREALQYPAAGVQLYQALVATLAPLVREAQAQGDIHPALAPERIAGLLLGLYLATFIRCLGLEQPSTAALEAEMDAALALIWAGIGMQEGR